MTMGAGLSYRCSFTVCSLTSANSNFLSFGRMLFRKSSQLSLLLSVSTEASCFSGDGFLRECNFFFERFPFFFLPRFPLVFC